MAMSDESWEEQFRQFLRKTGEDFRRTGEDIRAEAQKLLDAAMDPEKQQRVRERLNDLTVWARKTAHDVAGAVEDATSKAQTAFHRAKVTEPTDASSPAGEADATASAAHKPAATAKKARRAKSKAAKPRRKIGGKRKR
jgi:hypothetical protein